jgi:CheY-like chemotaxis protein
MPILIVDDTHADILVASALLEPFGKRGTVAFEDPITALTWCASNQPSLVLTDFKMARLDGIDFVRYMRALPTCRHVPVIMMTVEEPQAVAQLAHDVGIATVLRKPLDADVFATRVGAVLAARAAAAPALHCAAAVCEQALTQTAEAARNWRSFKPAEV